MTTDLPMIPFYIYYSMFGFQRFGDLVWAAGDARARGFIIGATAGRTTLNGEGLQHQDGHNLIMFSMVPNCVTYDPTFAYEMAVIIQHGLQEMYVDQKDVFYYITAMNENYKHPAMPEGIASDLIAGLYSFKKSTLKASSRVQLLGSGAILCEVIRAADLLESSFGISADIWSATSFNELRKDMESVTRYNRLHPGEKQKISHVQHCLENTPGPIIAATDYMKLYAEQIRPAITRRYLVLGTDGYGRSDTRAALRDFFEVSAEHIAYTAIKALVDEGSLEVEVAQKALKTLNISPDRPDPVSC